MKSLFTPKTILLALGLLVLGVLSIIVPPRVIHAFSSTGGQFFGGRIDTMVPCTCNPEGGYQLSVNGPLGSSGTYLYNSTARLYSHGAVLPSNFLLGGYNSGGQCLVGVEPYCETLPISKGTVKFTGTSLF